MNVKLAQAIIDRCTDLLDSSKKSYKRYCNKFPCVYEDFGEPAKMWEVFNSLYVGESKANYIKTFHKVCQNASIADKVVTVNAILDKQTVPEWRDRIKDSMTPTQKVHHFDEVCTAFWNDLMQQHKEEQRELAKNDDGKMTEEQAEIHIPRDEALPLLFAKADEYYTLKDYYHYQLVIAALVQATGSHHFRNDIGKAVIKDITPQDDCVFDPVTNTFLVGRTNKTKRLRQEITFTDERILKHLKQLTELRQSGDSRFLFVKDRSVNNRGDEGWYGKGFKKTMMLVLNKGITSTDWRRICNKAAIDAAGDNEEERAKVTPVWDHSNVVENLYYNRS